MQKKRQSNASFLDQSIIHIVKNENPVTVEELVKLVQQKHPLPQKKIIEHILNLQSQGELNLKEKHSEPPSTIKKYLLSSQAYWYWITLSLATATLASVFTIPEKAFPTVYARYILGAIFVLWLPSYSFIKAYFQQKSQFRLEKKNWITLNVSP